LRLISNPFSGRVGSSTYERIATVALFLTLLPAATLLRAQTDDDLYGLPGSSTPSSPSTPAASPAPADTAERLDATPVPPAPLAEDTAVRLDSGTTSVVPAAPAAPVVAPVVPTPPTPRARVTRETTINPLDVKKGSYRNPKKALFMSLLVPGLGQAYVGQSPYTYARAAVYFGTEVTLGLMWYQYTVVKYDRVTARYRRFADEHWSQGVYENKAFDESAVENFEVVNPRRQSFCDAVQERESVGGDIAYRGCLNLLDADSAALSNNYTQFRTNTDDRALFAAPFGTGVANPDSVGRIRGRLADPVEFYALIGGYQEFIAGWEDAVNVIYSADSITGTSLQRDRYNAMREQAQDYSRMQAWFIGGLVINHIASAVDAALTARYNNRVLYEGEARWYDRVKMDGGLAFAAGRPRTHMTARLSF
jgi:hypothetical protein